MNRREFSRLINEIDNKKKIKRTYVKSASRKVSKLYKSDILLCEECGSDFKLQVHHIDKNPMNNAKSNLIKLCIHCHIKKHEGDGVYKLMQKTIWNSYNLK